MKITPAASIRMVMVAVAILLSLEIDSALFSEAKRAKCTNKLNKYDDNFFYCTKFAVAKGSYFRAWYYAKFVSNEVWRADKRGHDTPHYRG